MRLNKHSPLSLHEGSSSPLTMQDMENMTILLIALADILSNTDEDLWRPGFKLYDTTETFLVFLIFLTLFLSSNLSTYMIRIYNRSLPIVNINIINTINLYLVEVMNISTSLVTGLGMWVSLISHIPFFLAYTMGLCIALLGHLMGGLGSVVGILKILVVLQVNMVLRKYFFAS